MDQTLSRHAVPGNRFPTGSDEVSKWSPFLRLTIYIASAVQICLFFAFLGRTIILHPFWDMVTWIDDYLQVQQNGSFGAYLWTPHNEHRLALVRLLSAFDVSAFHASGIPFVIAGTVSLIVTALIISRAIGNDPAFGKALRPLTWLSPMLLLTTASVVDCSIPINIVYPLALVFMVSALALFDGETERTRQTRIRRCAAVAALILSSLANSVGLVSWPVLLWAAWRGRASRRWLLLIAALGAIYGFTYVHDLHSAFTSDPAVFLTTAHLSRTGVYLLTYLGLPFSRAPSLSLPSRMLGGFLLAIGLPVILLDTIDPKPATRLHRLAIGLIMTSLAIAVLAAIGRVDMETELRVPVRYAVLVAPLHIGLLALAGPHLARWSNSPQRTAALLGTGVMACIILVALQLLSGVAAVKAADTISMTLERYDSGARDAGMEKIVFPDLAFADRVMSRLRKPD